VDGKIDKLTFSIAPPVLTEDDKNRKPMAPRRTRTERLEPQSEMLVGLRIDGRSVERRIGLCESHRLRRLAESVWGVSR